MYPSNTPSSVSIYSDCDCYLCQYVRDQKRPEPYPFGRTSRNPVVYYAQCVHGKKKDCGECRRPNVFVRAFRWYTNEHGAPKGAGLPCRIPAQPCKEACQEDCSDKHRTRNSENVAAAAESVAAGTERVSDPPNLSAFATWLDSKYQQYLIENAPPDACRVIYTETTSVVETCNGNQEDPMQSGPCGRKRFSKQRGDGRSQPYNPSMEFIMPPKNLFRAASDCCYAPTASGDRREARSRSATATVCINKSGYDNAEFAKNRELCDRQDATVQYTVPIGRDAQTQYQPSSTKSNEGSSSFAAKTQNEPSRTISKEDSPSSAAKTQNEPNLTTPDEGVPSVAKNKRTKQTKSHVICECPAPSKSIVSLNIEGKADVKPSSDGIKKENVQKQQEKAQPTDPNVQSGPSIEKPSPIISRQRQFQSNRIDVQKPGPNDQPTCPNAQICHNIQKPCPSMAQQQLPQYQGTYSRGTKPGPNVQQFFFDQQEPCPGKTQQQQFQYQDTYSERLKPGPNYQRTCPNAQRCPHLQQPCPIMTQQQYKSTNSEVPQSGPNFQQYQDTYSERLKPVSNYQRTCPNAQTCPHLQQPCPSMTQQQYKSINSEVPQSGPNFLQYQDTYSERLKSSSNYQRTCPHLQKPCPSKTQQHCKSTNSEVQQSGPNFQQYQDTYFEVQQPRPIFQQPYPNLGGPTDNTCPSLRDPCIGRRPCPSVRKMCPPCPSRMPDPCKASAQQGLQNEELNNAQLQYEQSCNQSNQAQQEKIDLKTQTTGKKPTLRDLCFVNTHSMNFIQKQDPEVGAMPLKQEVQSFRQYAVNVDSRPSTQNVMTARQEERSFRGYASNIDSRPCIPGHSFQEISAETNTCSVQNQGTTLLYSQQQNSANCYCSYCCPNGLTYDKAVCCRKNESVQLPATNKNVYISTSTGEGKCSVNCPYYATVSIKGQTTQTDQTVQFSPSVNNTVQTSDTAIRLDRGTALEYPLFMRVVHADKLQ